MSFIEARLLEDVESGFSGGPVWRTLTKELRSGVVRRKATRSRPVHRFSASFDNRDFDTLSTLLAAFNATRGAAFGFRFRNWMDYELTSEPLTTGTGAEQSVQIGKRYAFGPESVVLPIRKPNADCIVRADGTPITATINTATGLATFTAPLGSTVTITGTYDIPVTFSNDDFSAVMQIRSVSTVDVDLVEDLSA